MTNPYCRILQVDAPSLGELKDHPEANTFSLLIVALREHGAPLRLADVAERFKESGIRFGPAGWRWISD